jgi:hypothetical protein
MITWNLDEKQADYILQVLQTRPFAEVHQLVAELMKQAQPKPPVQAALDLDD